MNTKKKNQKPYVDQNPVEAVRDQSSNRSSSVMDQLKPAPKDFWKQFLGIEDYAPQKQTGDLSQGEVFDLKTLEQKQEYADNEPGIDYRREILHAQKGEARQMQEFEQKIAEIMQELRQLIAASSELQVQFKEVAIEQRIENPGKYHLAFFEWMLSVIKAARMRVEDSESWLLLFASRKKSKQYWNMFKKHGTTFGLSNERVVATQTG